MAEQEYYADLCLDKSAKFCIICDNILSASQNRSSLAFFRDLLILGNSYGEKDLPLLVSKAGLVATA